MRRITLSAIGLVVLYLGSYRFLTQDRGFVWTALLLILPLVWLSVTDLAKRIIPDTATVIVAVLGIAERADDPWTLALSLTASFAAVVLLGFAGGVYWKRHGTEALGLGDAKLIGAGILVVGVGAAWLMVFLGSIGGIIAALFTRKSGEVGVPFGPFLAYSIYSTFLLTGSP